MCMDTLCPVATTLVFLGAYGSVIYHCFSTMLWLELRMQQQLSQECLVAEERWSLSGWWSKCEARPLVGPVIVFFLVLWHYIVSPQKKEPLFFCVLFLLIDRNWWIYFIHTEESISYNMFYLVLACVKNFKGTVGFILMQKFYYNTIFFCKHHG